MIFPVTFLIFSIQIVYTFNLKKEIMTGSAVYEDLDRTKRRRTKRMSFDKNLHYYKDEGIKNIFPKVTKAQLKAIREKLSKQQHSDRIKSIIAFALAIPVSIFAVILFFKFVIFLNS